MPINLNLILELTMLIFYTLTSVYRWEKLDLKYLHIKVSKKCKTLSEDEDIRLSTVTTNTKRYLSFDEPTVAANVYVGE